MPIPAQTSVPSGIPTVYDTLLLQLCILSPKNLLFQAYRVGAVGAVYSQQRDGNGKIVPSVCMSYTLPNSDANVTTLVTGLQGLVATYNTAKSRPAGTLAYLRIAGSLTSDGAITASVRLATNGSPIVDIPDAYALAATDSDFATLLTDTITLLATFNAAEKVV